jgi:hypothetical protein
VLLLGVDDHQEFAAGGIPSLIRQLARVADLASSRFRDSTTLIDFDPTTFEKDYNTSGDAAQV